MTRAASLGASRRRRRLGPALGLALAVTVALGALAAPSLAATTRHARARAADAATARATKPYTRIFLVMMENLPYSTATSLPGYQTLARSYASATDSYATTHPSLPNYLSLTGGSTFGISSDCTTCYVHADNLGAQLTKKHVSWGDYSEGVPGACYLGPDDGLYAGKHNPFRYYADIRASRALCGHLEPLTKLTTALDHHPTTVPRFSFVTPNLCHDGHSCSASEGFTWLAGFVHTVTSSSAWRDGGLLVVTWDEGSDGDTSQVLSNGAVESYGGGGHIPTLLMAPGVAAGTVVGAPLTHYSLLATIEANFKLPDLGAAASWASHTLQLP